MVLGAASHLPSAGYPQQGYVHKEQFSKQDYYKDGHKMHKEDYYKADNYGNPSSMQMMRPHSGPNHHGTGGYPHTSGHGYGSSGYSTGIPSSGHGYGNHHGSPISMGSAIPQDVSYGYQSHAHSSSSPYYQQQQNGSHGWISKDLDD